MPTTIVIEKQEEFIARHGGNPLPIGDAGWHICADGARYNPGNGNYKWQEPSTDEIGRREGEHTYNALMVKHLQRDADRLLQWIETQCGIFAMGSGPLPGQDDLDALEDMMLALHRAIAKRDELAQKLRELKGPTREEIQAKEREQRRIEADKIRDRVKQITGRDFRAEVQEVNDGFAKLLKNATSAMNEAVAARVVQKLGPFPLLENEEI